MANQHHIRCHSHNPLLHLHVLILGTLPNTIQPNRQLAKRPRQLHRQPQRRNTLQPGMHPHRNRPISILHRPLQIVHNRKMAKSRSHNHPSDRMRRRLRSNHDRRFLRRRRLTPQPLVNHILHAQPNSPATDRSIPDDTPQMHQSHTSLRISRSHNQLGPHLPVKHAYPRMVHRLHRPRICWRIRLQHNQTMTRQEEEKRSQLDNQIVTRYYDAQNTQAPANFCPRSQWRAQGDFNSLFLLLAWIELANICSQMIIVAKYHNNTVKRGK
jgi:hypothetical protein